MFRGFFYATLAACTFGLIPLFSLPIISPELPSTSVLFLRFGFSAIVIMLMTLAKGQSLRVCKADCGKFLAIGFFYALCAITFFWAIELIDSGIAATVQYCYPMFVVILMVIFFGERFKLSNLMASAVICIGVALFSLQDPSKVEVNFIGMALTIFSATQMALYVMAIQVFNLNVKNQKLVAMYILSAASLFSGLFALAYDGFIALPSTFTQWQNMALLTIVTGVISTMSLVRSVKFIGPSLTSILGGLEPVTAMLVGVMVFSEALTLFNILGSLCIVGAVTFVALLTHFRKDV